MNPKEKGDIATAKAISYYMTNGYEVLLPIGDKRPYDLVIESNGKLEKVQCKFTSHKDKRSGNFKVGMRITGGNQSFNTSKFYQDGDFDKLFVATSDGDCYEVPSSEIVTKNEMTLGKKYEHFQV